MLLPRGTCTGRFRAGSQDPGISAPIYPIEMPIPLFSVILNAHGRLAQRLAQVLYTHKAGGSNPSSPTILIVTAPATGPFPYPGHVQGFEPARARS